MKNLLFILIFSILCINGYAQVDTVLYDGVTKAPLKKQQDFKYLVKFKPLATISGLVFYGGFNFEFAFVPYVHPKVGIPIEIQLARVGNINGFAVMSGIEAVPFIHREKSGFYLNYELGGIFAGGISGFCTAGHVGYQLVTRHAFVFTPAVGVLYDTVSEEVRPHLMMDIGFALRRKR